MEDVIDSIVYIFASRIGPKLYKDDDEKYKVVGTASGTGFFVDDKVVMTNAHVVRFASSGFVQMKQHGEKKFDWKLLSVCNAKDLALIHVVGDYTSPKPLTFATTPFAKRGTHVNVLGHPLGILSHILTTGVVSGWNFDLSRNTGEGTNILNHAHRERPVTSLQISAPVNGGNSGGPLFDKDWNVIGVIFAGLIGVQLVNYAIPIGCIMSVLAEMRKTKFVEVPPVGFGVQNTSKGMRVYNVLNVSPFAMLQKGDILKEMRFGDYVAKIVSLLNVHFTHKPSGDTIVSDLSAALDHIKMGEKVTVFYERCGEAETLTTEFSSCEDYIVPFVHEPWQKWNVTYIGDYGFAEYTRNAFAAGIHFASPLFGVYEELSEPAVIYVRKKGLPTIGFNNIRKYMRVVTVDNIYISTTHELRNVLANSTKSTHIIEFENGTILEI